MCCCGGTRRSLQVFWWELLQSGCFSSGSTCSSCLSFVTVSCLVWSRSSFGAMPQGSLTGKFLNRLLYHWFPLWLQSNKQKSKKKTDHSLECLALFSQKTSLLMWVWPLAQRLTAVCCFFRTCLVEGTWNSSSWWVDRHFHISLLFHITKKRIIRKMFKKSLLFFMGLLIRRASRWIF